jgi:hypothetical protein
VVSFLITESPTPPGRQESASFPITAREVRKVWDLREQAAPEQLNGQPIPADAVVLTDLRLLDVRAGEEMDISFVYSTKYSACGASLTHPSAELGSFRGDDKARQLRVHVPRRTSDTPLRVVNQVAYFGGWRQPTQQDVNTQLDEPTAELTFLIVFPLDRRCTSAYGEVREKQKNEWEPVAADDGPTRLEDGALVYWRPTLDPDVDRSVGRRFRIMFQW